jgi:RNA polymerase sigma-70 factor (ECF subfamily)
MTVKPISLQINWQNIIVGCKENSPQAQEHLYRHCYPEMIRICQRYFQGNHDDASWIYNQAMLKVFQGIHQYVDSGKPEAWIRRIVTNTCIDYWRTKVKFEPRELDEAITGFLPVIPDAYNRISGNEIISMINELPKNTGLVFNLYAMEGYKHYEIGKILSISPGTSKWHLNEARRLLKQKLESVFKKENLANAI